MTRWQKIIGKLGRSLTISPPLAVGWWQRVRFREVMTAYVDVWAVSGLAWVGVS